jgi:hypothetical protein
MTPEIVKRIAKVSSGGKMSITSLMARKLEPQRIDNEVIIIRTLEVVIMTHSCVRLTLGQEDQ